MSVQNGWAPTGPARYGLAPEAPATTTPTDLAAVPSPSAGTARELTPWDPSSPMFWIGVLGAVTFGLMAVSTTVRVGPAKGTLSVGK